MFSWWKNLKRKRLLEKPFPTQWNDHLESNLPYYSLLPEKDQKHLKDLVQIFVAEKDWHGGEGLDIDDEIKVTIAAHACLLILKIPHDYYNNVISIFVYPSTVLTPKPAMNFFGGPLEPVLGPVPILGAAHYNGPLILVWDSIKREVRHPEKGHNVIFHEFAHKLDMMDGYADGTPLLKGQKKYKEWAEVCTKEFENLRDDVEKNRDSFFDPYGATNEAEFFAVITEYFFTKPKRMKEHHPRLYGLFVDFYQQDPANYS